MATDLPAPRIPKRAKQREQLPRTSLFAAVMLVGGITLTTVVMVAWLLHGGKEAPDGLIAIAGAGLGSLGTFLARGQGSS